MPKKLSKYNQKRDFKKTSEPIGKSVKSKKKLHFCVQHHAARKDHYDLRLELNGVLISWAVPKGPSYNPKDKRLAVHVEDHPLSYRHFEGTIPKGEYGGGTVMLWDYGEWEPISKNPQISLKKGSLKFYLKGNRLRGAWTLIKYKENNWLLIKENDSIKLYNDISYFNTSIKTGRTMEEIAHNFKAKKINEEIIIEGVKITNPNKVIFKNPKITKLDIVLYYQSIAPLMLPLIKNRLISVIRAPSGVNGPKFFKKHLENTNSGLGKIKITNNKGNKEDYYYIKNIKGLISEVQMNSFEFHIWGSKVPNINKPDMLVFDLDPDKNLSLKKVREGVLDLKSILDELNLNSNLKTSGGKGYHIIVPIKNTSWSNFRTIAKNIAELMVTKWPQKYTSNMSKEKREGKIFIDWFRNTLGATSVAPYSLRLREKAPISMPISWDELNTIKPNEIRLTKKAKNKF
ncbi:MAG: non-homologous end-joining DNA ligase [Bacilli bacterium]|nr:non-homologous end-joining DNA ligase [Bacilli bacterium]